MEDKTKKGTTTKKKTNSTKKPTNQSNKKSSTKKVSTTKSIEKKEIVNENSKNKKTEKKDKSLLILKIVFVALVILVIFLFGQLLSKKKELDNQIKSNIIIAVVKKDERMPFSIALADVKEGQDYIIKVTNYRGDNINDYEANYSIDISNTTDSKISFYEYDGDKDLIQEQNSTLIENLKLPKNKKKDVYYKVHFDKLKNVGKKDVINIAINS